MTREHIDIAVRAWARKAVLAVPLREHKHERALGLVFACTFTTLITTLTIMVTIMWYGPMEPGSASQIIATVAILVGLSILVTKVIQENWAQLSYDQIAAYTGSDIIFDMEYRFFTNQQMQMLDAFLRRLTEWTNGNSTDDEVRSSIASLIREMEDSPHWDIRQMAQWRLVTEAQRYHKVTDSMINPYRELGW